MPKNKTVYISHHLKVNPSYWRKTCVSIYHLSVRYLQIVTVPKALKFILNDARFMESDFSKHNEFFVSEQDLTIGSIKLNIIIDKKTNDQMAEVRSRIDALYGRRTSVAEGVAFILTIGSKLPSD